MYPDGVPWPDTDEVNAELGAARRKGSDDAKLAENLAIWKRHVLPSMCPNLTFCFPSLRHAIADSGCGAGNWNPFTVMIDLLGGENVLRQENVAAENYDPDFFLEQHASFEDALDPFFLEAAKAIYQLQQRGQLKIEFCHNDLLEAAANLEPDRPGPDCDEPKFSRIFVSNVPDYIGLLPVRCRTVATCGGLWGAIMLQYT